MNTKTMNRIKYKIAKEEIPVWKVFIRCRIHGKYETPFYFKSQEVIDRIVKHRIGIFAFLTELSAEGFKEKLSRKRKAEYIVVKYIIPKSEKYRVGYLPAGCHSAGMKCIAANRILLKPEVKP